MNEVELREQIRKIFREYQNEDDTIDKILNLFEPVQLEVITDEEIREELKRYFTEDQMLMPEEIHDTVCSVIAVVRKATIARNEAKGQLYRKVKE